MGALEAHNFAGVNIQYPVFNTHVAAVFEKEPVKVDF